MFITAYCLWLIFSTVSAFHCFVVQIFFVVFVLIGLTFSAREVEGKYLFRRRDHNSNQSSSNEAAPEIECRVFKETILHSNQFGSWDEENFACYPIVNGIESDQDYKISLPTTIKDAYRKDIEAGDFFITLKDCLIHYIFPKNLHRVWVKA